MFNELRIKISDIRANLLITRGINNNEILGFGDDINDAMSHLYYKGIPLSIYFKYMFQKGRCFDYSLIMTLVLPGSILVRADTKYLELRAGKGYGKHGWVEKDGWVYDVTTGLMTKKELFYELYGVNNVEIVPEYVYEGHPIYQDIKGTTLKDLQPNGSKRDSYAKSIESTIYLAEISDNPAFKNDLRDFLKTINFGYKRIRKKKNKKS